MAAAIWFSSWLLLAAQGLILRREVKAIMAKIDPVLAKASVALDTMPDLSGLSDLKMVPATIIAGINDIIEQQLKTQGSPLRAYTSALVTEGITAADEMMSKHLGGLKHMLPAAAKVLGEKGVEARMDKKEGLEAANALLERFGPFKGLVEKFIPQSGRSTPSDLLENLAKAKRSLSAFSPQLGAQVDSMLEQVLMSELGGAESGGLSLPGLSMPGIPNLQGLVRLRPAIGESSSTGDTYGR
jgi:hypothetical protein